MRFPSWRVITQSLAQLTKRSPPSLLAGLRTRLLVMLLVPLVVLLFISAWFDFNAAGSAAIQQDLNMQRLAPLLADSIVAEGVAADDPPIVLLSPAIEDFIQEREGEAEWGVATLDGRVIIGPSWLSKPTPATAEPEFHSEVAGGTVYRIMALRANTAAGELVLLLADGSDARQSWLRSLLLKVLLPNVLLMAAVAFAVSWAVARALKPLTNITRAVAKRSPRDLSPLDASQSPPEVRPLVQSLNHLFELVSAQNESQRRFVADAAHQLRTPLAGLQAQVEAWVQAARSPEVDVYHENRPLPGIEYAPSAITLRADELLRLRDATRRTSQLATQLLALSRAESHSFGAQPMQQVDLRQLCADALAQQLDHASSMGVDLGLELIGQEAMVVAGHDWLLRELLVNLTDNAIRYTAGAASSATSASPSSLAPQVTIAVHAVSSPGRSRFLLQVRDNGPGIPVDQRAKALQRFYRLPGSAGIGNGLGLAIAQEIAKLHHSSLELQDADPAAPSGQRGLLVSVYLHAQPA
jgi:two-component system, OmpR family, sensor histidine kinase TctE